MTRRNVAVVTLFCVAGILLAAAIAVDAPAPAWFGGGLMAALAALAIAEHPEPLAAAGPWWADARIHAWEVLVHIEPGAAAYEVHASTQDIAERVARRRARAEGLVPLGVETWRA